MQRVFLATLVSTALVLPGCAAPGAASNQARLTEERSASETHREDLRIEARAIDRIYEGIKVYIHVNVTSFNRNVLISGEVPDAATRASIEKIVAGVEGVRQVNNELVISGNSSLPSRSNDSMISSNIKLRIARDKRINAGRVRVVTENGTVFLLGNISRAEADAAADVASTANGVKLVVKMFEYAD
jgi:osmotically-inducible protein OsmY